MSENGEEEQKDPSLLTSFVNVISGAKQSATIEFDKFCENIGWRPKPKPVVIRNKYDMVRVQAGQSIHGRILPDRHRHNYVKDAEIQTDDISEEEFEGLKRRSSVSSISIDREMEEHRPTKMLRRDYTKSIQRPNEEMISNQLLKENIMQRPNDDISTCFDSVGESSNNRYAVQSKVNFTTGSKSVKRLTSELEKIFSAKQPPSFKKTKVEHNSERKNENIESKIEKNETKEEKQITKHITPKAPPPPLPLLPSAQEPRTQKQGYSTASEQLKLEEERMRLLEKKLGDIHSKMNDFAIRTPNDSPIPSHTVPASQHMSISPNRASPIRQISTPITKRSSFGSISSPRASYNTPSPIKDVSKIFQETPSPIPKPTERHISKMRVLIQQIPMVQLRKTDKIIGPDGLEKPNPVWHEIYGKKRRV
ncbi:hypothetical protein G6F37_010473 [Rhizopus arrhizus]|nr:hypothetical protein G6F38_010515 [Rhizopus arrhizus]KAG1153308.1 hypothetical protein G6F37_010473 [Rhizopus arrhizus]